MTPPTVRFVAEARRLAAGEVGSQNWTGPLVQAVHAAGDDDLGTMVVAHALLIRATQETAAEQARLAAAAEERKKADQLALVERHASARQNRRRQRGQRLRGQVLPRLIPCAVYAVFVGFLTTAYLGGNAWSEAVPVFGVCAVAVAASLLFDWFAFSAPGPLPIRNPAGRVRQLCVATGAMLGVAPWLRMLSEQGGRPRQLSWGDEFSVGPFATNQVTATLPIMLSVSWIIGGLIVIAVGSRTAPATAARIDKVAILRPLAWLGAVSSASAVLLYNIPSLETWIAQAIGFPQVLPRWNPLGLWSSPTLIIIVGMLAVVLYSAARNLTGRAINLGVAAWVAGPVLGVLSLFTNPAHLVTVLLDWGIRAVT